MWKEGCIIIFAFYLFIHFQNDSIDLSNKVVYDRDDPNRPRFTMLELKEILYERNELKARVSDLEDELSVYRPSPSVRPYVSPWSTTPFFHPYGLFARACDLASIIALIYLGLLVLRCILHATVNIVMSSGQYFCWSH